MVPFMLDSMPFPPWPGNYHDSCLSVCARCTKKFQKWKIWADCWYPLGSSCRAPWIWRHSSQPAFTQRHGQCCRNWQGQFQRSSFVGSSHSYIRPLIYWHLPENLPPTPKSYFWSGIMTLLSLLVQSQSLSLFPPTPLLNSLDLAFIKVWKSPWFLVIMPLWFSSLQNEQTNKNFSKRFANDLAIEKQLGMIESGCIHISQQFFKVKHLISEELYFSFCPWKITSWP